MSYEAKYQKYKQKYLELKQQYQMLSETMEQSVQQPQFGGADVETQTEMINLTETPTEAQVEQQPQSGGFLGLFKKNKQQPEKEQPAPVVDTVQTIQLSDTPVDETNNVQQQGGALSPAPFVPSNPVVAGTPGCVGNVNPVPQVNNPLIPQAPRAVGAPVTNNKYSVEMDDMREDNTTTDIATSQDGGDYNMEQPAMEQPAMEHPQMEQDGGNTEMTNTEDIEKLFSQLGGNLSELGDSSSIFSSSSSMEDMSDLDSSVSISDI